MDRSSTRSRSSLWICSADGTLYAAVASTELLSSPWAEAVPVSCRTRLSISATLSWVRSSSSRTGQGDPPIAVRGSWSRNPPEGPVPPRLAPVPLRSVVHAPVPRHPETVRVFRIAVLPRPDCAQRSGGVEGAGCGIELLAELRCFDGVRGLTNRPKIWSARPEVMDVSESGGIMRPWAITWLTSPAVTSFSARLER